MAPYTPSPTEIEKGLDEVFYEIEQLAATAAVATSYQNSTNAMIESRLLHVRALIALFEENPRIKDDILASDYNLSSGKLPIEQIYRDRLDKDLAHLTYARTKRTASDKDWPHDRVVLPVLERCRLFIDHVLATRTTFAAMTRAHWEALRTQVSNVVLSTKR